MLFTDKHKFLQTTHTWNCKCHWGVYAATSVYSDRFPSNITWRWRQQKTHCCRNLEDTNTKLLSYIICGNTWNTFPYTCCLNFFMKHIEGVMVSVFVSCRSWVYVMVSMLVSSRSWEYVMVSVFVSCRSWVYATIRSNQEPQNCYLLFFP